MLSRYKRQLIRLNMKKKWPTRTGMEDSRPIFFCKRFSYNENALYIQPFSQKSRTPTVAKEFQIGLCGVVEADLELFATVGVRGFWENGYM